jgi:hypothetical protein
MALNKILDSRRTRTSATRILFCAFLLFCIAIPQALSAATFTLTVRKLGDGFGTVSGTGFVCDRDCSVKTVNVNQGSSVTVSGSAEAESVFLGFMGDRCFGPETCTFTMSSNITLYASFGPPDSLGIRYSSPSNGDTGAATTTQPTVFFNRDILAGPNLAEVTLLDAAGAPVPFTPVVGSTDRRLVLVTPSSFAPGATYTVEVPAGAVADTQGNLLSLAVPYSFTFTTANPANPLDPKMYISVYPPYVMEGDQAKVSIWFESPALEERTITLTSTPAGEIFHPSEIFLPAGQVLAEVPVTSRYNHGSTSPTTVTFSAAEPGVGQRSTQIVVANNTSVTGAFLKWQAGSVVSDTDHDGVFEAGEIADIKFEVANFGPSTINNVTLVFSVINSYGVHILGGEPFQCILGSLAAGHSANCTRSFRADSNLPTADYFIQVQGTSSQNGFVDQARVHIVNNSQPDFVLVAGSFPSGELLPDSVVILRYTARNNGDGFSDQLPLFEVTLDVQGSPQLLYQTYAEARGYVGSEQSFRLPLRVPSMAGTYTIRARINPPGTGRLTESNYANNDAAALTLRVAVANQLIVTTKGNGTGTVTSLPGGIDCGTACSAYYAAGAVVTLTASPAEGSVFTGWTGEGCSGTGSCMVTMNAARAVTATFEPAGPPGSDFYTVTPCRLLDTRSTAALLSQVLQSIPVAGLCGVPSTAQSVVLNVTVVSPTGSGHISLWPADLPTPSTSVINFATGQTRGNNVIVGLATDGGGNLAAKAVVAGSGTVHLILDVSGYFQ